MSRKKIKKVDRELLRQARTDKGSTTPTSAAPGKEFWAYCGRGEDAADT
jgi:hypothetical protein